MTKILSRALLVNLLGWRFEGELPQMKKYIIILAPHTSGMDFIIGRLYSTILGLNLNILQKKELFFFPLGSILKYLGGIPVDRGRDTNIIFQLTEKFDSNEYMALAIAPEGTRKKVTHWKRGFYYIAQKANVPIVVAYLDYKHKVVGIKKIIEPSGDMNADMMEIKNCYKNVTAKIPNNFSIGNIHAEA
ncbi:MAG: lysophospholipid acyltransferase family protein [Bacteroidetes bacterium]|nr:lysophospholipid acyltransferase family protein [Bacteroidota bacterium]